VSFGSGGRVYAASLVVDRIRLSTPCESGIAVQRSDDGGRAWRSPVFVADDNDCSIFNDKPWIVVDDSIRSLHRGRIYVLWSRYLATPGGDAGSRILVSFSDDQGASWSGPRLVSPRRIFVPGPHGGGVIVRTGAQPLVGGDGLLTVIYDRIGLSYCGPLLCSLGIVAQTSSTDVAHFARPVSISDSFGLGPLLLRTGPGGFPSATLDPKTGDLYVAWQDERFRRDDAEDIVISRSQNGGRTWAPPRRVNGGASNNEIDHFTPAVAAFGGVVQVTYFTFASSDGHHAAAEHYAVSTNRGSNFGFHRVLSRLDLRYAAADFTPKIKFLGDYQGIATWGKRTYAVWCRSFLNPQGSGTRHQTTWSATMRVLGDAGR
jgi:hypothetical protein